MSEIIYCIPMMVDSQKPLLDKHCFGDCGKISMAGAIDTGDVVGPCWVCCQKECPYEKGTAGPVGESELDGSIIYIRVLEEKAITKGEG